MHTTREQAGAVYVSLPPETEKANDLVRAASQTQNFIPNLRIHEHTHTHTLHNPSARASPRPVANGLRRAHLSPLNEPIAYPFLAHVVNSLFIHKSTFAKLPIFWSRQRYVSNGFAKALHLSLPCRVKIEHRRRPLAVVAIERSGIQRSVDAPPILVPEPS